MLFLAPVLSSALRAFHEAVHRTVGTADCAPLPYTTPGRWIPHCSLARHMTAGDLERAIHVAVGRRIVPLSAEVEFLSVVDLVEERVVGSTLLEWHQR